VISTGEFINDLRITLTELLVAFTISSTLGIMLGYLISRSRYSIRVFEPLFAGIYSVPVILFLPLYILAFGWDRRRKSPSARRSASFPSSSTPSPASAPSTASSSGQRARWAHPISSSSASCCCRPRSRSSSRACASASPWRCSRSSGSETIASLSGLGHRIVQLGEGMDMARMFAYIAFAVAIALALNTVTSALEAKARRR